MPVRRTLALVYCVSAIGLFACGNAASRMVGEYNHLSGSVTLEVTADKMMLRTGPMTLTAGYRVLSVKENQVSIEISGPGVPRDTLTTSLVGDTLNITGGMVDGRWHRK